MMNEYEVINKSTGKIVTVPAYDEFVAIVTAYILEEEEGIQQNYPRWYRKKLIVIEKNGKPNTLVLGDWTVKY